MRKHKKVLFIALAAVLILGGTLGIVAFAQADDQSTNQTSSNTLMDKVAAIYEKNTGTAINAADLKTAFDQAQQEMATEARDNALQKLVDDGKISQAQADNYKTWLDSKPSQTVTDEYKQWLQSMPQGIPFGPGLRLPAMPRGFDRMGGKMFRGWCPPNNAN
jgi:type IV secretory pathway VirJ component